MPSPIGLQMGPTVANGLSNDEGWHCASLLRLKEQYSVEGFSASSFLRTPLTACCSTGVRGKICLLTLQRELWLSYTILWLQFLSQTCVSPVSLQRYMFPNKFSFSHFQSHLWTGVGPSWPRILDKKITLEWTATTELPNTSIASVQKISQPFKESPQLQTLMLCRPKRRRELLILNGAAGETTDHSRLRQSLNCWETMEDRLKPTWSLDGNNHEENL